MQRRSFLGSILAACAAPAFVRAGVLMPIKEPIWVPPSITDGLVSAWTREHGRILPPSAVPELVLWGDGTHDDVAAITAFFNGDPVRHKGSVYRGGPLPPGRFKISAPITLGPNACVAGRGIDVTTITD
jgi:hypothetical protein